MIKYKLYSLYQSCSLCPRNCQVDRTKNSKGYCGENDTIRIACACLHHGEEPPLTGRNGSGTIFFSGCTLRCHACQNYQLSINNLGGKVTVKELSKIILRLEHKGATNINLVTGTHFIPGISHAVDLTRKSALIIPVIWNTSSYETSGSINLLNNFVNIYLADLKSLDHEFCRKHFHAYNYPPVARAAIGKMVKSKPLKWNKEKLDQGVIIRHLVLPGHLDSTRRVLSWFKDRFYKQALLSLLFQFIPVTQNRRKINPDRLISEEEYCTVLKWLDELNIKQGYFQEYSNKEDWLPDFTRINPFPAAYAKTIWHYEKGFIEN